MSQLQAYTIDKFLGVNKSATETLLQLGEANYKDSTHLID